MNINFVNDTKTHILYICTYIYIHAYRWTYRTDFKTNLLKKRSKDGKARFLEKNDACYQICSIYAHSILGYTIIY